MTDRVKRERANVVISCFDLTCTFLKPWSDAGYECHAVDIQHPTGKTVEGDITKWGMDVFEWEKMFFSELSHLIPRIVFAGFFPPCTDLAVSGARWFQSKEENSPGTRKRAMDLVYWSDKMGKTFKCPYFIENPVSVISSEWRKPNFSFNPFEYGGYEGGEGDGYTKKTCLWTGGGFTLPSKKPIALDPQTHDRIWKMGPSPERQNLRSKTPEGFARAVFETYGSDDKE
jgi:hypothetical protein